MIAKGNEWIRGQVDKLNKWTGRQDACKRGK